MPPLNEEHTYRSLTAIANVHENTTHKDFPLPAPIYEVDLADVTVFQPQFLKRRKSFGNALQNLHPHPVAVRRRIGEHGGLALQMKMRHWQSGQSVDSFDGCRSIRRDLEPDGQRGQMRARVQEFLERTVGSQMLDEAVRALGGVGVERKRFEGVLGA